MPHYRDAAYGGETVTLENAHLRLELHKRVTGWGWGELYVPGPEGAPDRFFAVLEHLAEAHVAGMPYPMRLEAQEYQLEETDDGQTLTFQVEAQQVEPPDQTYEGVSPLKGVVTLRLPKDEAVIHYQATLEPQFLVYLHRIRGPWLRVGADSFGADRHDAIFPGIEWLEGEEWSSGTDWFEHPQALRLTPHPHKVAAPIMAISHDGIGLGLSWTPDLAALSAGTRLRAPQPVFASPNFVDRRPHHLLGVMWPSARWGMEENALAAVPPVQVRKGLKLTLDGQISVVRGDSLDVLIDWIGRNGMPDPGEPRFAWDQAIERIMQAYNTSLWVEGQGFRGTLGNVSLMVPACVERYIESHPDTQLARELQEKVAWCRAQPAPADKPRQSPLGRSLGWGLDGGWTMRSPERAREIADQLLPLQSTEGDFTFDPRGRHRTNLSEWADYWRPLGQPGDSALDLCAEPAATLLIVGRQTGEEKYLSAARKALDFAMRFTGRPEGGDWWETPLHSPNLLAAGNAAIAYELAYRQFGDARYRERAIHWIRCLLPFTHLWEPPDIPMLYNTKPCLNSTCWYLSDWVSKHVEWEVLRTFAMSDELGIHWAQLDSGVDWDTYQKGITVAAMRWMIDHDDPAWMFGSEFAAERTADGAWDLLYTDTFDPVHNTYGGGPIAPANIADNVAIVLRRWGG